MSALRQRPIGFAAEGSLLALVSTAESGLIRPCPHVGLELVYAPLAGFESEPKDISQDLPRLGYHQVANGIRVTSRLAAKFSGGGSVMSAL